MTTRRSFMGLLGACVLAVSTSIPVLNRDQVTPSRPPTVEVVRCERCGWIPSSPEEQVQPRLRFDGSGFVIVKQADEFTLAGEQDILDGNCFRCEMDGFEAQTPPSKPWDETLAFRTSHAR